MRSFSHFKHNGHVKTVCKYLIELKETYWNCCWPTRAEINAKYNDRETNLKLAAENGRWDVVEFLRQHGGQK
jgi:hypothetical protein